MIRELEHLCYEERLRRLIEKILFTKTCRARTRGNSFKLKEGRCRLYIMNKLLMVRVLSH